MLLAAAHGFTADHGSVDVPRASLGGTKTTVAMLVLGPRPLIVFSLTPSSVAAERVFSLLKALFGSNQDMALADYTQGFMMVRYNGTKRRTSF